MTVGRKNNIELTKRVQKLIVITETVKFKNYLNNKLIVQKKSQKDSLQADSENLTVNLFHDFPMTKFA